MSKNNNNNNNLASFSKAPSLAGTDASSSSDDETSLHNEPHVKSVLVIGATGETGTETIRQLAAARDSSSKAAFLIYGMGLSFLTVPQGAMQVQRQYTESLISGDATRPADLQRALQISQADTVVVSLGHQGNKTHAAVSASLEHQSPSTAKLHVIVVAPTQDHDELTSLYRQSTRRVTLVPAAAARRRASLVGRRLSALASVAIIRNHHHSRRRSSKHAAAATTIVAHHVVKEILA